jgi:RHS repeat-associated protein
MMKSAGTRSCAIRLERKLGQLALGFALHTLIAAVCVVGPLGALLQGQSYLTSTGIASFAAPYPAEMGTVDAASGNLHLEIPLGSFPQRGQNGALVPKLLYDSHIWMVPTDGASAVWTTQGAFYGLAFDTWSFDEGGAIGVYLLDQGGPNGCDDDEMLWSNSGVQHYFNIPGTLINGDQCSGGTAYAADSSGFQLRQTAWGGGLDATISVFAPDGTEVYGSDLYSVGVASKDPNGNYLGLTLATANPPGIYNPVIDTLGRKVVTVLGNVYSSPMTLSVLNAEGGTSNYVITYTTIPVLTDFQMPGVAECNNNCTAEVITSIGLPDGTSYSFTYDCYQSGNAVCNSPEGQSGYYGTLTSMTLPTGATITYGYSMFGGVSWENSNNEYPSRWLTSKTSSAGTWTYNPVVTAGAGPNEAVCLPNSGLYVGCMNVQVTRPDGSFEITSFIVDPAGGSWPQVIQSKDNSGVLLSTVNNTWDFSNQCTLNLCFGADPDQSARYVGYQDVRKLSTSTTVPVPSGNITKQTTYTYDTPQTGNLTAIEEWKYQSGTFPSVPDRATYITYKSIGTNNNINHPIVVAVCNNTGSDADCPGGGSKVAKTTITYDAYGSNGSLALADAPGVVNHDDTNFGTSYTTRGNPTQISRWVSGTSSGATCGSTCLTTALSYYTTGQVIQALDPNNNATTYSYADSFYSDNGADPPSTFTPASPTNAYVTKVTDPTGTTSMGYYYGSGQPALGVDYDGRTTYAHYVDPFDRPTETVYPIGWTLNQYHLPVEGETELDSYAAIGTTTASTSCASCAHTQVMLDSFGRAITQSLVNNPAGQAYVNTAYDSLNRVSTSSHPNFGSSDPNDVVETSYYDGLSRSVEVAHPDGEFARSAYGANVGNLGGVTSQQSSPATYGYGFPVLSLDEGGKQRQEWLDGFGHVIEVDEPSSTSTTAGTAIITISGTEGEHEICITKPEPECFGPYPDTGSLTVTINGFAATASWGSGSTAATVAASLAGALNSSQSPVTASVNGTSVTMMAVGFSPSFSVVSNGPYYDFSASPTSGTLSGGSGGIATSPVFTSYTYDALGNLTSVIQGSQTRSYQYDGLSRLTQEITPEAGTVTLAYVTTTGALCSGSPSNPCSRTAPATNKTTGTVTTTYAYNTANQLTKKTHSDTTGTESYTYGTGPSDNNVGRLTKMTDPSGSEAYSYDEIGRVTQVTKIVGTTSYPTKYAYNAGSELTKITYPSGRVVEYSYDDVGHLCEVAATAAANCGTATSPYVTLTSASYDAASRPLSATYGNGVVATAAYSPQTAELTSLSYAKGSTTLFGLNYYYQQNSTNCPTGNSIGNNGQIQCIGDVSSGTGDAGRSAAYTYDALGRLVTANTKGSTQYPAWGLSWTYDRYGNRTAQTVTAGSGYTSSLTINPVNNQVTSPAYTYDGAGNVIAQPAPLTTSYTYDGEECNTGYTGNGNTAAYTCDGNELRVEKVVTGTNAVTTVSIRSAGQVIAEYDNGAAVTAPTREYLYGYNLLAIVTGSTSGSGGTIIYQHHDHLGPRLYTDVNGNCVGDQGTFPYGEVWYQNTDTECSTSATSSWIFTSYERDAESGDDYALARSYANTNGRFLSPDPLEGIVGDPQSWNRYAYVENDPINLSDPSGQGFWEDLAFAIADIFAAILLGPEIDPVMTAAEAGGEAGANEALAEFIVITDTGLRVASTSWGGSNPPYVGERVYQIGSIWFPDESGPLPVCGGCDGGGVPGAGAGGGPGAGTGADNGAGGQGPGLPNGDVAIPAENDIWHPHPGCMNCGAIWGQSQDFVYDFMKSEAIQAVGGVVFESVAALRVAAKAADEGIYEFTAASGKTYVGQSGNISARIEQHLASGKLLPQDLGTVRTTEVLGGRIAREIAEQLRINELGGIKFLENIRNPIGLARRYLLP